MCDFQKGDVVVRVPADFDPVDLPGQINTVVGTNYVVSAVKVSTSADFPGAPICQVSGACAGYDPADGHEWWFRQELFRRVHRWDSSLISKLLEPVDLGVKA